MTIAIALMPSRLLVWPLSIRIVPIFTRGGGPPYSNSIQIVDATGLCPFVSDLMVGGDPEEAL